jgi:heterodisulfide reductase subunit B
MSQYAYYPGCSLEGTGVEFDQSSRAIAKVLGIQLKELPDWNCCGASQMHKIDPVLSVALPARDLALAEKLKMNITAPCPACSLRLKTANYKMEHDEKLREQVNSLLTHPYNSTVKVQSFLETVYKENSVERIREIKKYSLDKFKIAPYYGCLLVRPKEIAQFDDDENPTSMDELLAACGAEIIDYPFKTECCGASYGLSKKEMVLKLTADLLDQAVKRGANAIAVACPLCHQNLDMRQKQINSNLKMNLNIPVYYFTELIGLAFGFNVKRLGIDKHSVDSVGLVEKCVRT